MNMSGKGDGHNISPKRAKSCNEKCQKKNDEMQIFQIIFSAGFSALWKEFCDRLE
jgi:hypothetical protein